MHTTGAQQVSSGRFFMKLLGCDINANVSRPEHSEGKKESIIESPRTSTYPTINPRPLL
jgi:hypothetical protein